MKQEKYGKINEINKKEDKKEKSKNKINKNKINQTKFKQNIKIRYTNIHISY